QVPARVAEVDSAVGDRRRGLDARELRVTLGRGEGDLPLDGARRGVERVEVVVPGADVDHTPDLDRGRGDGAPRWEEPRLVQRADVLRADQGLAGVEA